MEASTESVHMHPQHEQMFLFLGLQSMVQTDITPHYSSYVAVSARECFYLIVEYFQVPKSSSIEHHTLRLTGEMTERAAKKHVLKNQLHDQIHCLL